MSIIIKQLNINQALINLPKEIIDIIKDYIFYNIKYKIMRIQDCRKIICELINNNYKNNIIAPPDYENLGLCLIKINDNNKLVRISCRFCKKCGDYIYSYVMTYNLCNCITY